MLVLAHADRALDGEHLPPGLDAAGLVVLSENVRPDAGETLAVVVMALTLSLLATLYPAWRAARLDPVEALRYE